MITRYILVAERLKAELQALEQVVRRAESALAKAKQYPQDQDYFLAAAALDLHSFYSGIERLFEVIASSIDNSQPSGRQWHRDLMAQMTLEVADLRPAVLSTETQAALLEYLEFRHVVRNVYTFNLRPTRVAELVTNLRLAFTLAQRDLQNFVVFLEGLSTADDS
ncbi:MAG: hypothetical protein AB1791_05370 [Chloroflexota bacterium]